MDKIKDENNDLISRKELLHELYKYKEEIQSNKEKLMVGAIIGFIKSAPIAFDKDEVIEELREELNLSNAEKERCVRENPLQFDSAKGYANGITNAIEIVEKGGIK